MTWIRNSALVGLAVAGLGLAGSAFGVVSLTDPTNPHNINNTTGVVVPNGEICLPCHVPHNVPNGNIKLFNRTLKDGTAYTLYESSIDPTDLDERSKLCLSCHDGTIAVDNYVTGPGSGNSGSTMTMGAISAVSGKGTLIGTDLSNDHPVAALLGSSFPTPTPSTSGLTGTITSSSGSVKVYKAVSDPTKWSVGCCSCHTPHDYTNKFIRFSNAGSALCLTCHTDK